ncbi:MAG: hypothetical protein MUF19_01550 [Candidatus Pacebacteria bacterium]|jgi:hypothetical protein|nr:hypothetical protein [Candidatus Paceibacterota bacterium]
MVDVRAVRTVQRNSWPVVGKSVWVPEAISIADRVSGEVFEYKPVQKLVMAVGQDFVIFDEGPELNIKVCRGTETECQALCRVWNVLRVQAEHGFF